MDSVGGEKTRFLLLANTTDAEKNSQGPTIGQNRSMTDWGEQRGYGG